MAKDTPQPERAGAVGSTRLVRLFFIGCCDGLRSPFHYPRVAYHRERKKVAGGGGGGGGGGKGGETSWTTKGLI